jgi:hypothetical protein
MNLDKLRVAIARITQLTIGASNPSITIPQLHKTLVSPDFTRFIIADLTASGVEPSICSAFTPFTRKASHIFLLCRVLAAKTIVDL